MVLLLLKKINNTEKQEKIQKRKKVALSNVWMNDW